MVDLSKDLTPQEFARRGGVWQPPTTPSPSPEREQQPTTAPDLLEVPVEGIPIVLGPADVSPSAGAAGRELTVPEELPAAPPL